MFRPLFTYVCRFLENFHLSFLKRARHVLNHHRVACHSISMSSVLVIPRDISETAKDCIRQRDFPRTEKKEREKERERERERERDSRA